MSTPDFEAMSLRQLRKWVQDNEGHPDHEEAADLLFDWEQDAAYERETFGEPEDTPSLDAPWWKNP